MKNSTLLPLALLPSALAAACSAQELYVNAGGTAANPALGTGALTRSGVSAPLGAQWSELATEFDAANILGGVAAHAVSSPTSYRVADDFTIAGPEAWTITGLRFFAYEPSTSPAGSPVLAVNVRIWNAPPATLGASVVWGDTATNIATISTPTPYLRVFSTNTLPVPLPPNSARPIWQIDLPVSLRLPPANYWIDWQFMLRAESSVAFTPTATVVGSRSAPDSNALQFDDLLGWSPIIDQGRPAGAADIEQDLPFVILGGVSCPADIDNSGGVDGDDVILFFARWDVSEMDFNGDGGTDGDDVIAFFGRWDAGC